MRRMARLKGTGEKLGGKQMGLYRQNVRFRVKMVDGGSRVGACDMTQGPVLEELQAVDGGRGVLRENDWSGEVEERADDSLKCSSETLLVMAKGRIC